MGHMLEGTRLFPGYVWMLGCNIGHGTYIMTKELIFDFDLINIGDRVVCVCVYNSAYVCMCVSVSVCMCVSVSVCACVRVRIGLVVEYFLWIYMCASR